MNLIVRACRSLSTCARDLLALVQAPAHRLGEQCRRGVRREVGLSRQYHASRFRQRVGQCIHRGRHRRPGVAALHDENRQVNEPSASDIQRVRGHSFEVVQAPHGLRGSCGFLNRVIRRGAGYVDRSDD